MSNSRTPSLCRRIDGFDGADAYTVFQLKFQRLNGVFLLIAHLDL